MQTIVFVQRISGSEALLSVLGVQRLLLKSKKEPAKDPPANSLQLAVLTLLHGASGPQVGGH